MKIALVNPSWRFDNSIYFGCREPHLPLELGASQVLLEAADHEGRIFDGHLFQKTNVELANEVAAFAPDMTVVTTAPSYLFWRCAPPELRIPREFVMALGRRGGQLVAVGPHGSVTPQTTLAKLGVDVVVRGECEEIVAKLAEGHALAKVPSIAFEERGTVQVTGEPAATRFVDLPPLRWSRDWITRHHHHHHRFECAPSGPGAEVEASRGCPYSCSFCAKIDYRDRYRRRELTPLLQEIDALIESGATYIYFIDEIFLPQKPLLDALIDRPIRFGVQTRIDLWKPEMLDLLGRAGCVSVEAGVESLTAEGRAYLDKNCRLSTDELAERLVHARRCIPFVQANLIKMAEDDPELIRAWRSTLEAHKVWANDPVPLYPYPSSPDYRRLWGKPDDKAWERAHDHYLNQFQNFSDIQDERPLPLSELECQCLPS
ncbi:MAG: TIGR04295 family B12-binding domain-containing radical SAM protein [Hyphomicrobiales bacterium]|nr:TIGR04295 family B12-binding domain-containing radical SAM protein [Hyphomicrobiales bacterium]MBV8767487.1 TIGR04295 family B12-binding domain-containing radical SAM protein [Hyphomicrobiales bacterium]MBV9054497.1 TIGR04295 family B12-binding domain-containing radical SAM protein [Hyphomicrobiales bacterium]MBV9137848.1 TIGR04295 family B12-binding domain-containing radical SAM protein [Hyphomicrobiales bacterium]MBV9590302.1 TIGR04295 family B12-binding domain-containing radical SAM prote